MKEKERKNRKDEILENFNKIEEINEYNKKDFVEFESQTNIQTNILIQKMYEIFKRGYICDNCLGRQFAQLLSNMDNRKRGKILRNFFAFIIDFQMLDVDLNNFSSFVFRNEKIKSKIERIKQNSGENICYLCNNFFTDENLKKWKELILRKIKSSKIDFRSYVVGTKLTEDLAKKEEELWEDIGIDLCEPIKTEINRTIGKEIEKELKIKANLQYPDVLILLDLENEEVSIRINPLFIYGEYQKLVRGIAQTKSRRYETSVEEIIAKELLKVTKGIKTKFHGAGREDVDARCLGWRPFIIEVIQPKKRYIDLKKLENEVNKSKKIRIRKLRFTNVKEARELKEARHDKEYRVVVICDREINKNDLKKLKKLQGIISQRTPLRVIKRRGDKLRKRVVKSVKAKLLSKNSFELIVRCEAGLYVKELVSGDNGRTRPSVSEILNCKCEPKELDVIKIYTKNKN